MERRASRKQNKRQASAELSPAEALMLRLENIEPGQLEKLGAEEERRIGVNALRGLGSRMDSVSMAGSRAESAPRDHALPKWAMPAASDGDGAGRQAPRDCAKIYGDAMACHGLRHCDRVQIDHDVTPADGDIVLAEIEGVGRVARKLSIIGGVHVLSAGPDIKPIVVEDLATLTYHGVVISPLGK